MKYSEKLLDPRWQKKRLEILQRDNWTCQCCFSSTKTLHVHHRRYLPKREPWDIENKLLITLCADCHEFETNEMQGNLDDLNSIIKESFFAWDVHKIAEGFNALQLPDSSDVFSSVIKYWFSNKEMVKQMYDVYVENVTNNSKVK